MSYINDIKNIYNFIKVCKIEIYMFIFMHNHIICHKLKIGVWMIKELMCGQPMTKEARGSIPSNEIKMHTCNLHNYN